MDCWWSQRERTNGLCGWRCRWRWWQSVAERARTTRVARFFDSSVAAWWSVPVPAAAQPIEDSDECERGWQRNPWTARLRRSYGPGSSEEHWGPPEGSRRSLLLHYRRGLGSGDLEHRLPAGQAPCGTPWLELRDQRLGPVHAPARRLRLAPHVLVARLLGLDPRLLQMGDERHDAVHVAVEVGLPLRAAGEVRARLSDDALEVLGDLLGAGQVALDAGARLVGRALAGRARAARRRTGGRARARSARARTPVYPRLRGSMLPGPGRCRTLAP